MTEDAVSIAAPACRRNTHELRLREKAVLRTILRRRSVRLAAGTALAAILALVVAASAGAGTAHARSFTDVDAKGGYYLQIQVLAQLGVIEGYSDGSFRPEQPLMRQQFAKMVVEAMRISVGEEDVSSFPDVRISGPGGLYPDNYVAAAAREGIVNGRRSAADGHVFDPGRNISLAQLITMGSRAAGEPLVDPPSSYSSVWGAFDAAHGEPARRAQYNGLLRELPLADMSPWRSATRAEAAALLHNLLGSDPESVTGRFLGTSADLVRYFRDDDQMGEKFSVPLPELARLYVHYGSRLGIRADVAWGQMIHETGWGRYGGDVLPAQNNMAGIGATGGGEPGNSFATAELGVIAHMVHLAWYAYPDHMDDPYCISSLDSNVPGDPRHFATPDGPHKGNVRTVGDLGGKWAPSLSYGERVQHHVSAISRTRGW